MNSSHGLTAASLLWLVSLSAFAGSVPPAKVATFKFPAGSENPSQIQVSPNGKLLIVQFGYGQEPQILDALTGKKLGQLQGYVRNTQLSIAFAADGTFGVTAEMDHYSSTGVDVWNLPKGDKRKNLDDDVCIHPFTCVCVSPDGKTLAFGPGLSQRFAGKEATLAVHLWDSGKGEELRQIPLTLPAEEPAANERIIRRTTVSQTGVSAITFSPNQKSLALALGGKIVLIELLTGKEQARIANLPAQLARDSQMTHPSVRQLAFSPDGKILAGLTSEDVIRLWDMSTGNELAPLVLAKREPTSKVSDPVIEHIIVGKVTTTSVSGGAAEGSLRTFFIAADSKTLHAYSLQGSITTWNLADARQAPNAGKKLGDAELTRLWQQLRTATSGPDLFEAVEGLASRPEQALALFQKHLKPTPFVEIRQLNDLLRDLEQGDFNQRKKAAAELRKHGELALIAMHSREDGRLDDTARKFMDKLAAQYPTLEQVQHYHALQILHKIGTPAAQQFLETLAKGAPEALLTREAKRLADELAREKTQPEAAATLEKLWTDLGSADASQAYVALRRLANQPMQAVPFLKEKIGPLLAGALDDGPEEVAKWIAFLDSADFPTREKAQAQLTKLGQAIEPILKQKLASIPTLEQKNRIDQIVLQFASQAFPTETLQLQRGLEVLEWAGQKDAISALHKECTNAGLKKTLGSMLERLK